ncbi:hypothetical protein D9619_000018 [Psilocybe cf. subviscida]|uniref:DUF6534 domain-containing protein n=1 Tax=Psilocybe cf. subviscida TaxID=2480587 RepID=A0A8H5BDT8_9AGAR|nr:hypothetical protein D9619_000018 [Psilocybe cf. subviscida]
MDPSSGDLPSLTGAPIIGFMVGCILFGCTLLQAYQYFMNYVQDSKFRKVFIISVCFLDTLHLVFSAIMIYRSIVDPLHHPAPDLVWTLKGMVTTQALLIVIVQMYYLRIIWTFVDINSTINPTITSVIRKFCLFISSYALAALVAFISYVEGVHSFSDFSKAVQRMLYIGVGSTAVIDTINAAVLCHLLFKAIPQNHQRLKSRGVIRLLILFFFGTGVLTAIAAIATIIAYFTRPFSVLYLAIEFTRSRLYANSILAMFNSKAALRQRMQVTSELKISSTLIFGDNADEAPPAEGSPVTEGPTAAA